jgi:hypothetical protein
MAARAAESMQDNTAGIKSAAAVDVSGGNITLSRITRGIYIGASGNISVIFADDNSVVTLVGLAAGMWHPMQVQQINQTGTTATGIFAGY